MKKSIRLYITGSVQGVFFRMETKSVAERYGVSGWVRNKRDGTVEAVFEGDHNDVAAVIEWCRKGPPRSNVTGVDVEWEEYIGEFGEFEITY